MIPHWAELRSAVRRRASAFLVQRLSALDDSFALNRPAARSNTAPAHPRNGTTPGASNGDLSVNVAPPERHALVLNERSVIASPEVLELFVRSMFPPPFDAIREEITAAVIDGGGVADAVGLLKVARAHLTAKAARAGYSDDEALACLAHLAHYERDTEEVRTAYLPEYAPNPNAVLWPDPLHGKHPRSIIGELPYATTHKFVTRDTPIGSAGSCFATEIAHRLQADGFNYVITEPNPNAKDGLQDACARWGTIFNAPSLRQLAERAFGIRHTAPLLWSTYSSNGGKGATYRDVFRDDVWFDSVEEYEAGYAAHVAACREAFLKCRVFVATVGLNEVWRLRSDGTVLARSPWRLAPGLVERGVLTVDDNITELQRTLDILRAHNPELRLIVTVSPVPLHATHRAKESHIISANCHSKSLLRVALEQFVKGNEGVYYFPSYEVVTSCTREPWLPDERHVSREAVGNVMRLFDRMFVADAP